ncbi:MAG: DUF3857 domain-containing transglutaminase family protein [Pseudomonadota bacterium]
MLILLTGISASAQQYLQIRREATPSWVDVMSLPEVNPKRLRQVEDGVYTLVQDDQIRLSQDGDVEQFSRNVRKVTDRSGLEAAAQLEVEFDPAVQQFILHKAVVWRDGKAIDLSAVAATDILRRENELDDGILTDTRTVLVRLNDVRVGDITDFSWRWVDTKSYWPSHFFGQYSLGWSVPVANTRVRVVTEQPQKLVPLVVGGTSKPVITSSGGSTIFNWTISDPDPLPGEEHTPDGRERWPRLHLSTMSGWAEVVEWARPLYAVDQTLPPDLMAKVDAIAARTQDKAVRVTAALRLVQDNVRYTSLSIGSGGYVPRPPRKSWSEGFGDCKDKAALLIAILGRLDIKASPALTDIDEGHALKTIPPSARAFDHVIVRVDGFAKPLWLDPTISHQGGVAAAIANLTYGYALPLRENQTGLEAIPVPTPRAPTIAVSETHTRADAGVSLVIRTVYKSDEADSIRASLAKTARATYEANDLDYYADLYPGIEQIGNMAVSDDRDANVVVITQRYFLPKTAKDYASTLASYQLNAWTLRDLYKVPAAGQRVTAFSLPNLINREHSFRLITPGYKPDLPKKLAIAGTAFTLERTSARSDDTRTITYKLTGKTSILPASQVAAYRDDAQRLTEENYVFVDLDSERGVDDLAWFAFSFLLWLKGGCWLAYQAARDAKAQTNATESAIRFHPVGLGKFLILTTFTIGTYSLYWFWRCWRNFAQVEAVSILPLLRAIFSIFWFWSLFSAVNRMCQPQVKPRVGIIATIAYVGISIMGGVAEATDAPFWQSQLVSVSTSIALFVIIRMINRINDPLLVADHSRLKRNHWLALLFSLPFWGMMITGF